MRGAVVDFIDLYYGRFHWPAFNVADAAISVGAAILILASFFGGAEDGATRRLGDATGGARPRQRRRGGGNGARFV